MPQSQMARHRIDETTYHLLVVLSAKLEALHVYERFDGGHEHDRGLREQLQEDDRRHADLLVDALRERLGTGRRPDASTESGEPLAQPEPARGPGYTPVWLTDRR